MNTTTVQPFYLVGLTIRTTNEHGQSAIDIPQLWERFFSGNTMAGISNRADNNIYCVYTDYEKDHTRPYTTILGCRVDSLDAVPEGLAGRQIEGGAYTMLTAKGRLADGIVYQQWTSIWESDIPRVFTADFEVYPDNLQYPDDIAVAIYVAI